MDQMSFVDFLLCVAHRCCTVLLRACDLVNSHNDSNTTVYKVP